MKTLLSLPSKQPGRSAAVTLLLLAALCLTPLLTASADVITLKSGESVEGRIVVEGSDIIRIEVQVTPSIKETKTFPMTDVAKVEKTAPDKIDFAKIKEALPTRSLMTASDYDDLIRNGPKKFLNNYPDSEHRAEVETILTELEAEKQRVERGGLKLDGKWIDREERQLYRFAVDARVRLDRIRQKAKADNLIGALRDFEALEKNFAETPAHVTAVQEAQQIISAWGAGLQRKVANADILNQRDEASLKLAPEDQQRLVREAREAERVAFAATLKREKDQGMTWMSISDRDKQSLNNAIDVATKQLERLRSMDVAALDSKAKQLTEANRLIGAGDLSEARLAVAEAARSKSSSSRRRSSSRSKSKTGAIPTPTSYSQWLLLRIDEEEAIQTADAKAKALAAESVANAKLATVVPDSETAPDGDTKGEDAGKGDSETKADPAATSESEGSKPLSRADIMAAEKANAAAKRAAAEKAAKEGASKKKPKPSSSKTSSADDEKKKPKPPARSSGGGINIQVVVPIIAVILMITILVLKKLGIGGAPKSGGGG